MSAPQFKKRQHAYVQCRSWTDISKQNARYSRGFAQEEYDKEIAGAQEIDGIIENTGESLARILGVARIIEKPDASRWLHARKMEEALAEQGGGLLSNHVRCMLMIVLSEIYLVPIPLTFGLGGVN